jgi:putative exosortase-associated protein (TIGR04073 family)
MMTRKKLWTAPVALALVMAMLAFAVPTTAQHYDPTQEIQNPTGLEKSMTKLGRGLSNVLFGWAEIPVTFDEKLKQGKSLQYLLGVVPVLGTTRAVMRTGTGVFEMVTFPFSDRDVNYEAVLQPEYLF